MNLKPINDHVIVKPVKKEDRTKSGIVLPDSAKDEKSEQGEIVAVGPGKLLDNGSRQALQVKVGDTVLFKKYSPDEFTIDEVEYLILAESDILAVIEK